MTTRVIVTGSRKWKNREAVWNALDAFLTMEGDPVVVIEGGCPIGADLHAREWAEQAKALGFSVECETHRARWADYCGPECEQHRKLRHNGNEYCPAAGFIRNQEMVDSGADACLAFSRNNSSGTHDCAVRAVEAGITTRIWRADKLGHLMEGTEEWAGS